MFSNKCGTADANANSLAKRPRCRQETRPDAKLETVSSSNGGGGGSGAGRSLGETKHDAAVETTTEGERAADPDTAGPVAAEPEPEPEPAFASLSGTVRPHRIREAEELPLPIMGGGEQQAVFQERRQLGYFFGLFPDKSWASQNQRSAPSLMPPQAVLGSMDGKIGCLVYQARYSRPT